MRRGAIVSAVLGFFVCALLLASIAEARVGGGGSSGSRGSRSYSAPRAPSGPASPMAPGAPSSPQRTLTPPPGPQRPGGLFGGFGGMLGGFLLGGLLGSLLFGGLGAGFGGIGLLDILLVAGLGYLAFAFFRRREPAPAVAGGAPPAGWAPAERVAREEAVVVGTADEDLERGVMAIRMMDPGFDPAHVAAIASDVFLRVQAAWTAGVLASAGALLTEEMVTALESDLTRLRTLRRVNRVERVSVHKSELTEAWQESGRDFVTVLIRASAVDYTIDETTGAIVEGSASVATPFEEYWTFTRPVGPNPWRLAAIQQPSA